MFDIFTVVDKVKELFFEVLSFTEDVREVVEKKFATFKKRSKIAIGVEIGSLIVMVAAALNHNTTMVFISALGAVVVIIITYFLASITKDILIFGAKMLPKDSDKDVMAEKRKGLEKIELNLLKFTNTINHFAMTIATIALLMLIFGFSWISWPMIMITTLIVVIFTCIGFFTKAEIIWPRKIIGVITVISTIFWLSTLETEPSRILASWLNVFHIGTAENTDNRNGAIAKINATLYSIDTTTGNMEESSQNDTILNVAQFVRLTTKNGETRRINGELFTKIIIPNHLGSYARGKQYWIQPSFLERGVKFYPNANDPEYAVKKKGNTWEVYFTKDMITLQDMPLGKKITVTGEGAKWYDSEYQKHVPIISGQRTEGRTIVTSTTIVFKKGGKLIIFFS